MEVFIIWLLFGVVTAVVATNKGRNGCGWFLLGVPLGPFGFILSLVVPQGPASRGTKGCGIREHEEMPLLRGTDQGGSNQVPLLW
jgi:hypothetical protein